MSVIKSSHGKGVELCFSWTAASGGDIPPGTVHAGDDIYVMRADHNGEYVPGKLAVGHDNGYIAYGGEEHSKGHYEVSFSIQSLKLETLNFTIEERRDKNDGKNMNACAHEVITMNQQPLKL